MKAVQAIELAMTRAGGDELITRMVCEAFRPERAEQELFDMCYNDSIGGHQGLLQ